VVSEDAQPAIVMITIDLETSSVVFTRSDGKEARLRLQNPPFADTSALSRLHYTLPPDTLVAVTRAGHDIIFELPKQGGGEQLTGRLVVYLDQNQWSVVDNARHDSAKIGDEDREATRQLAEWVQQRRIVLPASSGHYYETTKRFDRRKRYDLGLTVLQLSRGWQMRDPLQIRRDELHNALCHSLAEDVGTRDVVVFTLAPNVIHGPLVGAEPYLPPSNFQPEAAFQHEALTSATAQIDLMLDSERVEPGPDPGWARANQQLSDRLDGETRDSHQKRKSVDDFLLHDMEAEIAEEAYAAGVPPEQLRNWMRNEAADGFRELPSIGLFREMMHDRHLNKGTVWKPNDLTDMVYLSCATGYADFVVCERHMGSVLTQGVRRLGRPTRVFRRLRDAVPAIEAALSAPHSHSDVP
jgi:hypothetical protein